jgi:hypothetical protein
MANGVTSHYFHAEAHALTGKLNLPFEEQIKKQAFVKLEGDSQRLLLEAKGDETGKAPETRTLRERKVQENYLSQHAKPFRLENIISYSAAHTQVSGHRSNKNPKAFVTLATSFVENLNVLNVVTADRVVGQISTTHLPDDYSPQVTFLGTHFENLRIARHKAEPLLNLAFAGKAPKGRDSYYPTQGTDLMESVEQQYSRLRDGVKKLKSEHREMMRLDVEDSWLSRQYHGFANFNYKELQRSARDAAERDRQAKAPVSNGGKWDGVTCSLVEHVEIEDITIDRKEGGRLVIPPPARSFGHVIHVPDFGTIFLAELKVNHNSFHLTMIRLELGCIADGRGSIVTCSVNGRGSGGN